ncbi:MAG TPA: phosphate ABC transporter permease PstA [Gammaproteobacteria bacterium]|nr:phosphate ABC transporter permease PstA [Gammaproteobacteria bacterium]
MTRLQRRKLINHIILGVSGLAAIAGLLMLVWILSDVFIRGIGAINWSFFTELPAPPGMDEGGLANAIVGTFLITTVAALLAVPLGVMAGTWLSEFGRDSRLGSVVRYFSDILVSAPSIVIGVFVYLIIVKPLGHFSGWAGSVSLAIIMLPVVSRTSEEMLKLVPHELREASLALGSPYWRTMLQVIYRAAASGMITGIMLAIARVAGETAPLLFTALNSPYWLESMNEPVGNLTVTLFNYAMSPYDDWHTKAWGAALLITMAVLTVTLFTRLMLYQRSRH